MAQCADALAAVLAVDMPGIDAGWFRWLAALCGDGGAAGSVDGRVEPLAAIYPAGSLAVVTARLERGELSVAALAHALSAAGRMAILPAPKAYRGRVASLNEPASPSAPRDGCS
jgi:molybdopterin-guanine dinucleotide biosynthesis protein A